MEYYSVKKKNEIMPFGAIWMQLGIIILSEVSQTEKDKYHRISLKCGIEKKNTNEIYRQTRNRLTDIGSKPWFPKEKEKG